MKVLTGDKQFASTDGKVYIELIGWSTDPVTEAELEDESRLEVSEKIPLISNDGGNSKKLFERNKIDVFHVVVRAPFI